MATTKEGSQRGSLTLSRKPGERILVGNDIVLTIVAVRNGRVKVSIVAPRDVPVHREEVYQARTS